MIIIIIVVIILVIFTIISTIIIIVIITIINIITVVIIILIIITINSAIIIIIILFFCECLYGLYQVPPRNLRYVKAVKASLNFVFNGINYLQKKGCAMGTNCAPSYANKFLGWFEEKFIFPLLTNLSDFYLRFIDNIFLIWNGTKTEFDSFLKKINDCHPYIQFDYEINFLNTTVFKVYYKLQTKLYVKSTDRQSYLHSKSEHPISTKKYCLKRSIKVQ